VDDHQTHNAQALAAAGAAVLVPDAASALLERMEKSLVGPGGG
jgi:UDP-N-acetylglucosamine:LPS N-acetylglucosamine transferase